VPTTRFTPPTPPDAEIAALDDAEFLQLGREDAKALQANAPAGRQNISNDPYVRHFWEAGTVAMSRALAPMRFGDQRGEPTAAHLRAAQKQADANVLEVVAQEIAIRRRAAAVAAIHSAPERRSDDTIWGTYTHGVGAIAFTKGRGEADFVRKFRELIAALLDADVDDARSIESGLNRLTAPVKYPVLPNAAWIAADSYPVPDDREAEYARLTELYGPRAGTNGSAATTNGKAVVPKTRALRTRAAAALH